MTKTALVLGHSGQIGAAVIPALLGDGWDVTAASRTGSIGAGSAAGAARTLFVDRSDDRSFAAALGRGFDLLVDCVAFTASHGRQILRAHGDLGSAVVFSSVSVYADAAGRTLDEATDPDTFPTMPMPLAETQRRTRAGSRTYSAHKVALEDALLAADAPVPVTVLRPGAIYGPYSAHPRELWFVKRALDRRQVQLLNWEGTSRFQRSSVRNIAELVRLAAARPGRRVLHAVDDEAPSTAELADLINQLLRHAPREFFLPGGAELGRTPWSVPRPFVASMAAARSELGYRAVADPAQAMQETVVWIAAELGRHTGDWRAAFPGFLAANGPSAFDYAAEDAWVSASAREKHYGRTNSS